MRIHFLMAAEQNDVKELWLHFLLFSQTMCFILIFCLIVYFDVFKNERDGELSSKEDKRHLIIPSSKPRTHFFIVFRFIFLFCHN